MLQKKTNPKGTWGKKLLFPWPANNRPVELRVCHQYDGKSHLSFFPWLIYQKTLASLSSPPRTLNSKPYRKMSTIHLSLVLFILFSPISCQKVSLSLFYESRCPDSAKFIVNDLPKIFHNGLIDNVHLSLVPWGNAKLQANKTFKCQVLQDFLFNVFICLEVLVVNWQLVHSSFLKLLLCYV